MKFLVREQRQKKRLLSVFKLKLGLISEDDVDESVILAANGN